MIAVLAAVLTMGMPSEPPGNGPYDWALLYHDGVITELGETEGAQVTFTPRASHLFTLEVCNTIGCSTSVEVCAEPLPGDVNCDGAVGLPDWLELGMNFGAVSP